MWAYRKKITMSRMKWILGPALLIGAAYGALSDVAPSAAQQAGGTSRKATGLERAVAEPEPSAAIRQAPVTSTAKTGHDAMAEAVPQQKTAGVQPSAAPQNAGLSAGSVSVQGPVIVGRVLYKGSVPAPVQVEVNRDPDICGATMTTMPISVDPATHGLRNAIVHVESGSGTMPVEGVAQTPAIVRNKQCRFFPHVGAMQAGNDAEIINDDPVMHNTNMTFANRTVLNVAVVAGGSPIKKPMKKAGLHVVKCNVHKFMQAYRMVFDDPFFDQTTEAGQFRIVGVAPGMQTLTVWHETLGILQKEVQVPARGTVVVEFEYK